MPLEGPRSLRPQEVESAVELSDRTFRADRPTSMGDEYPLLFDPANAENLLAFLDGPRVVSLVGLLFCQACILGTRHLCALVGSVCTDPAWRGQGLATRLLQQARRRALEAGSDLVLISGGRGLYRRQGYVPAGRFLSASLPADALPEGRTFEARRWEPGDLPALGALHAAEPVRFVRPPQQFRTLLECGQVVNWPGETWLVAERRAGRPLAYFSFQWPRRDQAPSALHVMEVAGSRLAALAGARAAAHQHGIAWVCFEFTADDAELACLLRTCGAELHQHPFHGTLGIIAPDRFMDAVADLVRERSGIEAAPAARSGPDGSVTIELAGAAWRLPDMGAFTRLAFGPWEGDPLNGAPEALRRVVQAAFPLPMPAYGLNFT